MKETKIKCKNCNNQFSYDIDKVKEEDCWCNSGSNFVLTTKKYINCDTCGRKIYIKRAIKNYE